ncbi:MAG: hypothetical protein R3277_01890 [Brumimicrobium sp.]|nr:hypothetical protein [Brumimicrobium sp.]
MKKLILILPAFALMVVLSSCMKCEECHYDGPNGEVELGELCGDELEESEKNGVMVGDTTYEVHCHGH